jgi:hypothetical protein
MLGHVPPYGSMLAAQLKLMKSNTYQPLIEVRIQWLRCLLERYIKEKTLSTFVAVGETSKSKPRTWLLL